MADPYSQMFMGKGQGQGVLGGAPNPPASQQQRFDGSSVASQPMGPTSSPASWQTAAPAFDQAKFEQMMNAAMAPQGANMPGQMAQMAMGQMGGQGMQGMPQMPGQGQGAPMPQIPWQQQGQPMRPSATPMEGQQAAPAFDMAQLQKMMEAARAPQGANQMAPGQQMPQGMQSPYGR